MTTITCPYCHDACYSDNQFRQPGDTFDIWSCENCHAEIHTHPDTGQVTETFQGTPQEAPP